jgi:DNA-binding transcriptional regulator YdaS (Cro superfamily)
MNDTSHIARAVSIVGGQSALARLVGRTQANVSQWVIKGRVPAEMVLAIEQATKYQVTRHQLRPDIYPLKQKDSK